MLLKEKLVGDLHLRRVLRSLLKAKKRRKVYLINKKKYIKIGAAVVGTALVAYGGYKLYQNRDYIKKYAKLGKKNVDFIRNSNAFDYLDPEGTKDKPNVSALCESIIHSYSNDTFKDAQGIFDSEQIRKLTDDELRDIQAYTTSLYKEANAYLRDGDGYGTQAGKIIAEGVKSVLNKVTLNSDVDLQRGLNQTTARKVIGINNFSDLINTASKYGNNSDKFEVPSLLGVTNRDNGIMSTAVPFTNSRGKRTSVADYYSGSSGIIFELSAKAGQHAMFISPMSELKGEREVIFSPNSEIQLDGTAQVIDGIIHVFGKIKQ